jgi:hypothetical protein
MTLTPTIRSRAELVAGVMGRPLAHRLLLAAVGLAVACAATFAAHERLYSTFMEYDDEGYVLLTLQTFLSGQPLYDATYTQYGPAFYLLESGLRGLTGLPLTHDATRLKTLVLWLASAAISAGIVFRLTRSPWLALLGFGAAFLHLEKLVLEPGHPQEWCLLGLAVALLGATLSGPQLALWRVFLLGSATAMIACS